MADPRFIGLVHSLLSSAQAATGEPHSPMHRHLDRDGIHARRTATRSLGLLELLAEKTAGNLNETERAALHDAITRVRAALEAADPGETQDGDVELPTILPGIRDE